MLRKLFFASFVFTAFLLFFLIQAPSKTYAAVWPPPAVIDIDVNNPCQAYCQAQALADNLSAQDVAIGFEPNHWYVVNNGNGTYTVVCVNGQHSLTFRDYYPPPPPTPVPTRVPACNVPCTTDQYCQAAEGCGRCLPVNGNPNQKTCQPAPTSTPVPPTATPVPPTSTPIPPSPTPPGFCRDNNDCPTGQLCINNHCVVPTPTPIPFNASACTCDSISYEGLTTGNKASITAYTKVTNATANNARIVNVKFSMYEFGNLAQELTATRVKGPETVPAQVMAGSTDALTRYQSTWDVDLPNFAPGKLYKIGSQLDCRPKNTAAVYSPSNVMGVQTENKSIFASIYGFIARIFGVGQNKAASVANNTVPTSAPVAATESKQSVLAAQSRTNLQLNSFNPTVIIRKTCDYVIFRGSIQ